MRRFLRLYLFKILLGLVIAQLLYLGISRSINNRPKVTGDKAETFEGYPVTIFPLVNDTDKENRPLQIATVHKPGYGQVESSRNSITYSPKDGFVGTDSIPYTISDGKRKSKPGLIYIDVLENLPPTIQDDTLYLIPNRATVLELLANDTDREGDTIFIDSFTQPDKGELVVENKRLIYQAGALDCPVTFTYTISDGKRISDTGHVTLQKRTFLSKQFGMGAANNMDNYESFNWKSWEVTRHGIEITQDNLIMQSEMRPGAYVYLKAKTLSGTYSFAVDASSTSDFSLNNNIDYAILFGFMDNNNFNYLFMMHNPKTDNSSVQMHVIENGKSSAIGGSREKIFTDSTTHRVRIQIIDDKAIAYFDGRKIFEAEHEAFKRPGHIGFGSRNDKARFSNIAIQNK